MSQITLDTTFSKNSSLQIGDIIYYLGSSDNVLRIGPVVGFTDNTITCTVDGNLTQLTSTSYIFFSKDSEINTSGIIGYYAEVTFTNNSQAHAELFAVNSEIFISSN
tara:strand:- start:62 stop:382 length:321 start_codon:yes stop_codon:yes gene_type:complete